MKIRLLLVAGENERFIAAAIEAAASAFPGSTSLRVGSLQEAAGVAPAPDTELIAIEEASGAQVAEALAAMDEHNLPRWAVVASGGVQPAPFSEVIPASEWTPGLLARVFRTSITAHLMRREKDRLLGDLLSVGVRVTHDLRTPLGGILSATEALEDLHGKGAKSERSPTQPIVESTQDLVKIINQLALVAKATARPEVRQPFNMGTPVARALERLEVRLMNAAVKVSKPSSWPEMTGDMAKMESVWQSLVENALRHAGKDARIELGWEQKGNGYKFWVNDSGPGVPPEKRRLLFKPFHRLHEANSARGFGLPIVERLVHLQGGTCGYDPLERGGSSFHFTLPAR